MAHLFILYGKVPDRSFYLGLSVFDLLYYIALPLIWMKLAVPDWHFIYFFFPHFAVGALCLIFLVNFFLKTDGEFTTYVFYAFVRSLLNFYVMLGCLFCIVMRFVHDEEIFDNVLWICVGSLAFEILLNYYWSFELKQVFDRFEMKLWNVSADNNSKIQALLA